MENGEIFSVSTEWILSNALSLLTALIVLAAGWILSGFLAKNVGKVLPNGKQMDQTIAPILSQVVRYGILLVTLIIVLGQFGVETASILAILGAAGLAIALALQGTLSNIAAGVMLIWLRPIRTGEYIDAEGLSGTVVEIGLFGTQLRTYDGIYVFAPNSQLWDARITNYTREATRMAEIKIGIAYDANIAQAREVLLNAATSDERVLETPAPAVFVADLADSAVIMSLRAWTTGPNNWSTKNDLREKVKIELDNAGIEIPYNKLDVSILKQTESA
ncbi:mechanosensitive ion channel protein [Devosia pacifica]|uniref:Small-conductance mechanosensitive channel n=1 Tax=Devosia pacifica TaxID=1335967 RepID=A0A918VNM2_9HYPH|nr:mechanosensitive ion channel domain-containing protein [Devosia pacifica]GHA15541.1 mechanosensitive ion channel protein [Devosia pacifica]